MRIITFSTTTICGILGQLLDQCLNDNLISEVSLPQCKNPLLEFQGKSRSIDFLYTLPAI